MPASWPGWARKEVQEADATLVLLCLSDRKIRVMKSLTAFLFLVLVLFSCKKSNDQDVLTIPLDDCVNRVYGSDSLQLCFEEIVEDSRCPANANCVWQGIGKARFVLELNGQQHVLHLSTSELAPHYTMDTTIGAYHFQLKHLNPYPGTNAPGEAGVEISY